MASLFGHPRFVKDEGALDETLLGIKLVCCPRCKLTGALIGHGLLRGYTEQGSQSVVRGRRYFCSNRGRRPGCGRTFSVKLKSILCGFVARTLTLWCFLQAVLGGLSRRAAWLEAGCAHGMSLSSGYRLWRRLCAAQSALRVRLCQQAPAPASAARDPLAQLVAHLTAVVGNEPGDLLAAYQHRTQRGVFDD